jgi:hypothetical protein
MAGSPVKRSDERVEGLTGRAGSVLTPLERSLRLSLFLTPAVLLTAVLLARVRLPALPYSLLVVLGIWLACFIVIYLWQVQRLRARRR